MRKFLCIIPIAFIISWLYLVPAHAAAPTQAGYKITHFIDGMNSYYWSVEILYYTFDHWDFESTSNSYYDNYFYYGQNVESQFFDDTYDVASVIEYAQDFIANNPLSNYNVTSRYTGSFTTIPNVDIYILNYPYRFVPSNVNRLYDLGNMEPPSPEEGLAGWLYDMWEIIFDFFGWNDDFTEDLSDDINSHSGGAHHGYEYITPTPIPTPTPYSVVVQDNNGDTVYNITGFPQGDTNTTINNYGDEFDIFDVDVKLLPSGGISNPKDGLNSVMYSNDDVLSEIDMNAVGYSVSVLPSDWYVMLGVLISMPFIAGFIAKLLK